MSLRKPSTRQLKNSPDRKAKNASKEPGVTIINIFNGDVLIQQENGTKVSVKDFVIQVVQEIEMNKHNEFKGDFRGAIIFNDSKIKNAGKIAANLPKADKSKRDELKEILEQIADSLRARPDDKNDDAEAVAAASEDLMIEANKDQPNPKRLIALGNSLLSTANDVVEFAPKVVELSNKVVETVTSLFT